MKTRTRVLGTFMLLMSFLFLLPNLLEADTSVNQRDRCRWWKRHKAEATVSRLYYYQYQQVWQYAYSSSCNCYTWVQVWVYAPYVAWSRVKKDVDRGCPTASAGTAYSAWIFGAVRTASATAVVTNNAVSTTTNTNHGWLSAGAAGTAEDGCYDVAGNSEVEFSAENEFGPESISYNNVSGHLRTTANSNFTAVLRIQAFESHITEGMSEEEVDLQDDNDLNESTFYKLEIRIKRGQIEVLQDGEGTPTDEILSQLELVNNGDVQEILLHNLSFDINIPDHVDAENISVNYFSDVVYEPFEDDACGTEELNQTTPDEPSEMQLPAIHIDNNSDEDAFSIAISPNPTSDRFQLTYEVPRAAQVSIQLIDLQGRPIQKPSIPQYKDAGTHSQEISTRGLPAGTYLCRLNVGDKAMTKMIIVK